MQVYSQRDRMRRYLARRMGERLQALRGVARLPPELVAAIAGLAYANPVMPGRRTIRPARTRRRRYQRRYRRMR